MHALATKSAAPDAPNARSAPSSHRAPKGVHDTLRSPGEPLDVRDRLYFGARFGHDFGRVRIHADSDAAASVDAVDAAAYTVASDVVFGRDQYWPASTRGRQLIAHELTHVIQQEGATAAPGEPLEVEPAGSPAEHEARNAASTVANGYWPAPTSHAQTAPRVMRADPDAVGQVGKLRIVVGAGIQFWPTTVTDTRIGPVSVQPGLLSMGASRLNVIVGQNLTPRVMAREILPLWITATPFAPPAGGPAILPGALTELQLAQALLVYNQYYLGGPAMPNWRAGLRFPLPVEIDELTGMATVNLDVIRLLAASFDPAWTPALDQRAASSAAPPAATVTADVTAFLAAEPTALARGAHLAARAATNAQDALPFVRETFVQLGAGSVEVALQMLDFLVNREVSLLAAQRDGAAILAIVRGVIAGAAPAGLSPAQQASLVRANAMLARVAGAAAAAPSAAVPTRAEKTVTIDTVKLAGSAFTPATHVAVLNAIYAQCNVRFAHGVDATATAPQTTGWLGADNALAVAPACGAVSAEERALYLGARAAFGLGARIQAFFVQGMTGTGAAGNSIPRFCATGPAAPFRGVTVIQNTADSSALAHEVGHILLNSGAHPAGTLMTPALPLPLEITDPQCRTIYNNA